MKNRTVDLQSLPVGATYAVTGTVSYSRVASMIEGDELKRVNERNLARNQRSIDRPYTTITLNNACAIQRDPNYKRPEEIYAEESLFSSNARDAQGMRFTAINKGKILPWIAVRDPETGKIKQIQPEGELDRDLRVTVVMGVYQGKINKGSGMNGIIIEEEPRYYTANRNDAGLQDLFGVGFIPLPGGAKPVHTAPQMVAPQMQTPVQPVMQTVQQVIPAPTPVVNPVPQVAPVPTPQVAPAPVPQIAPQPAPMGQMPYNAPIENPYAQQAAPAVPQAQPNPYAQPQTGGIRYDLEDDIRGTY